MDTNSSLVGGGVVATSVLIAGLIYKAINHKHLRSRCCGKSLDVSLDIDDSTPAPPTIKVEEPIAKIRVPSRRSSLAPPTPKPTSSPSDQS